MGLSGRPLRGSSSLNSSTLPCSAQASVLSQPQARLTQVTCRRLLACHVPTSPHPPRWGSHMSFSSLHTSPPPAPSSGMRASLNLSPTCLSGLTAYNRNHHHHAQTACQPPALQFPASLPPQVLFSVFKDDILQVGLENSYTCPKTLLKCHLLLVALSEAPQYTIWPKSMALSSVLLLTVKPADRANDFFACSDHPLTTL